MPKNIVFFFKIMGSSKRARVGYPGLLNCIISTYTVYLFKTNPRMLKRQSHVKYLLSFNNTLIIISYSHSC